MENEKQALSDEERLSGQIQLLVSKIKQEDPEELEKLKALIKKNVPFFSRGAFSALLLKNLMDRGPRGARRDDRKPREMRARLNPEKTEEKKENGEEKKEETKEKVERVLPEGAKTLYINVGKMKKLYAKTLSQIIQDAIGVTKDDIYSIRIHDKYSFVAMSEENCQKAIEALNGKEICGRVAQVNFSNK